MRLRPAHLAALAAVTFWGWSFVATKILLRYLSPAEVLGGRLVLGVPLLLTLTWARSGRPRFSPGEWRTVVLGGLVLLVHFVLQITALEYTTATKTGWIIAVTPLTIALLSFLFLRERLNRFQLAGAALATAGILLLVSGGQLGTLEWLSSVGDWLILTSTVTWAIYTVSTRNISRARDPLVVTTMMLTVTAVAIVAFTATASELKRLAQMPLEGMVALLFLGLICSAFAFWLWQLSVARLGAARTGFFLYLEPVATTALAVPYLREPFTLSTTTGGLLVLAGVFLAESKKTEKDSRTD